MNMRLSTVHVFNSLNSFRRESSPFCRNCNKREEKGLLMALLIVKLMVKLIVKLIVNLIVLLTVLGIVQRIVLSSLSVTSRLVFMSLSNITIYPPVICCCPSSS